MRRLRSPGHHCFNQTQPIYPNGKSSSFQPIPCNDHRQCNVPQKCRGKYCTYHNECIDQSSLERLSMRPSLSAPVRGAKKPSHFVFGCGYDQTHFGFHSQMAVILGLGFTSLYPPFVDQIGPQSQGRFSYCLLPADQSSGQAPPSFLRFGADIPPLSSGSLRTTEFLKYQTDHLTTWTWRI